MAFKDKIAATDGAVVAISKVATKPRYPCPHCGKETKPYELNSRICTNCKEVHSSR